MSGHDLHPADVTQIAELEAKLAWTMERIAVLEAQVAKLTAQLARNSTNSSKPPSSDAPGGPRQAKPSSGRKPGGPPRHERNMREHLPVEQVLVEEALRDFQGFVDRRGKGGVIGEALVNGELLLLHPAVLRSAPKTRGMAKAILKAQE